jgi:hypothetical protein
LGLPTQFQVPRNKKAHMMWAFSIRLRCITSQ